MRDYLDVEKYSVLMSVYEKDNPEYLAASIESMLNQTIRPEQFVLVVDGAVPEPIEQTIQSYERNTELFTVVRLQKRGGLGNALNQGMQHCRNELVARMDADDISLPERCELELQLFREEPELAVVGCAIAEFYGTPDDIRTYRVVPESYEAVRRFMRKRQAVNHPTVIYKKSEVVKVGGYEPLQRKEDFDLFSRMIAGDCRIQNLSVPLYLYRADENNYYRRKSKENLKSSIYVYRRHLKRGGCSIADFLVICTAEVLFFLLPYPAMKYLSDKILRKKQKG